MSALRSAIRRMAAACAVLLALAGAGAVSAQPPLADDGRSEQAAGRQFLVMLRLSPDHLRPNAVYGGDYGDQQTSSARRHLAQRIARKYGLELVGDGWPMPLIGIDCYLMQIPEGRPVEAVITQVSHDPLVAWSEPVQSFHAQGGDARAADPLLPVQPAAKAWRLSDLHRVATGRGVTIAVVDSKVEVSHPDLVGQFVAVEDFVPDHPGAPERHGTGIAGVIAAKAGNGIGIAGIAPQARLMALRACWQTENGSPSPPTVCDSLSLAKAIHYAIEHNAEVINLSLTGPPDPLLRKLLGVAFARRISVVAAFDPALPKGGFPASEPGVIAVANEPLPSLPPGVYVAPGQDVPTTQPGGKWGLVNGSSYSAAHISGLVALVREDRPSFPKPMLVAAQPTGGVVDACATLLRASKACDCACPVASTTQSAW